MMKKAWLKPELLASFNQSELQSSAALGDWGQWGEAWGNGWLQTP